MSELFIEKVYGRNLIHAYVALAMARDVAQRYVDEQPAHEGLRPLLTTLDVTAELLEVIILKAWPEELPKQSLPMLCSKTVM